MSKLIKEGHAHGQVGVGKEFDAFGLGTAAKQDVYLVQGGTQVQWFVGQKVLQLRVLNGALALVEHGHLLGKDVYSYNFIVLRKQNRYG